MNTQLTDTPVAAAAAGPSLLLDQSVAKQLLFGTVLEENLFPYPKISEHDREALAMIVESIDRFLDDKEADFARWDRDARQPDDFVQALRDLGLFGLIIPEEFGGLGLSNAAYARVLAQTSGHDSSVSLTIGAHSSIGMKGLLLFGTDEQKARYLPRLATGEMIAAFCLTEPGAGSDAAAIRTAAQRNAGRQLDPERREALDHQRRHRRFLHGLRPHRRARGQDHRLHRRGRLAGREPRPARGQDGHPRLQHHHRRLQRRARAGRKTCSARSARASRWRWGSSTTAAPAWAAAPSAA